VFETAKNRQSGTNGQITKKQATGRFRPSKSCDVDGKRQVMSAGRLDGSRGRQEAAETRIKNEARAGNVTLAQK